MFQRSNAQTELDVVIARALVELKDHEASSDEYGTVLDRVVRLQKLKESERTSSQISPDTLILAVTNLVGIAMIIRHEHMNVITSKATGFVMRPK